MHVLEDAGLLHRNLDAFRANRSTYRIAEPLISSYHAIMRPAWGQLERPGSAARVWQASRRRFVSNVLGPHFEQVCREWTHHADPDLLGGLPADVGSGEIHDPKERKNHEVDVVVVGMPGTGPTPLLAIGEAKWNDTMGIAHLDRLRKIRDIITASGKYATGDTKLICYSGTGFNDKLCAAADQDTDVVLVDLEKLYS